MSLSIWLWGVAVVVPLVVIGGMLRHRPRRRMPPRTTPVRSVEPVSGPPLLAFTVLDTQTACDRARQCAGRRYPLRETPPELPLAECSAPESCRCGYVEIPDQRRNKADRRQSPDRRVNLRFEPDKPPRRKNHGRRRSDYQWAEESVVR